MKEYGPWMSAETAAEYLDFGTSREGVMNFRQFARRRGITHYRSGRSVRFAKDELDAAYGKSKLREVRKAG